MVGVHVTALLSVVSAGLLRACSGYLCPFKHWPRETSAQLKEPPCLFCLWSHRAGKAFNREDTKGKWQSGKEGARAGPEAGACDSNVHAEARFETGRGGAGGREPAHKRTSAQLLSLLTAGSIAINYCDLLHLLITTLFLLPTIAELFLNYSTLWDLFIMPEHLAPTASHRDLEF